MLLLIIDINFSLMRKIVDLTLPVSEVYKSKKRRFVKQA